MKLRQAEIQCGNTVRVCWLDKPIRVGNRITLKHDPGKLWTVVAVYGQVSNSSQLNRGWNNNI